MGCAQSSAHESDGGGRGGGGGERSKNAAPVEFKPSVGSISTASIVSSLPEEKEDPCMTRYDVKETLGRGTFSIVKRALRRSDGLPVAVKIVSKKGMKEQEKESMMAEVELLKSLQHPNIVQLVDFFESEYEYNLVLELMEGGELFERLIEKEAYTEKEAQEFAISFLKTIKHLHDQDVVHRDIKPENLLLKSKSDDVTVKLADFGFAMRLGSPCINKNAGSPAYVAPEVLLRKPVGKSMDMWSFGVVLFMLLGGYPPFFEEDQSELFKKICSCEYEFNPLCWADVSVEAIDLIKSLLTLDTDSRLTVDEALAHPWIKIEGASLASHSLSSNMVLYGKKYRASDLLKAAASQVIDVIRNNSNLSDIAGAISLVRKTSSASLTTTASRRSSTSAASKTASPTAKAKSSLY